MTAPTLADLERVMARSEQRRAERASRALNTLRPYERRIAREAAVMGYVLGHRDGALDGINSPIPPDSSILIRTIEACDGMPDLYPYLHVACGGRRRRITRTRLWPGETR
jgi:hypothetical protein